MQRRELIRLAGQVLLIPGLLAGCQQQSTAAARPKPLLDDYGLQLSTLNKLLLKDFEGTLTKVADIGYTQVEFSAMGLMGREPEQVIDLLAENALAAPVGRVSPRLPMGFFDQPQQQMMKAFMQLSGPEKFLDNVRHSLEVAHFFGQKYLNLPAFMPATFADLPAVLRNIDLLQQAGEICAAEGVLFGYHNHDWEFKPVLDSDGTSRVPYDLMLQQTDPDQVSFQLDSYWVVKAGGDLYDYLERFPGRFSSCHLKDIDASGAIANVGEGEIDFPGFIHAAKTNGSRYFFVERDQPADPVGSAEASFRNLSRMSTDLQDRPRV